MAAGYIAIILADPREPPPTAPDSARKDLGAQDRRNPHDISASMAGQVKAETGKYRHSLATILRKY